MAALLHPEVQSESQLRASRHTAKIARIAKIAKIAKISDARRPPHSVSSGGDSTLGNL
jgi:hypothetical protein